MRVTRNARDRVVTWTKMHAVRCPRGGCVSTGTINTKSEWVPSALLHTHIQIQRPKSGQGTMPSVSRTCNPSMPVTSRKPKAAQSTRHTFARQRFPAGPPQRIPPVEADDVPSCAMSSSNRRCTPARRVGRLSSHTASAMCCARGRVPPGAIGLCVNVTPRCCCSGSWWSATRCAE